VNSITITIPIPHRSLSPNARTHWATKAKKVKAARRCARWYAQIDSELGVTNWTNAISTVVWYAKTATHPDPDNALAMLKPYFDGLADAGVLANDRNLAHNPIRFDKDKANPRVELTITRVGGEEVGK
jgi:Holliday junction resolvase RusA-like endonuclease